MNNYQNQLNQVSEQIAKCRSYTRVTPNLFLDAYALAKTIHEFCEYKSINEVEKVLKKPHIVFNVEKCNTKEQDFSNPFTITILDNYQVFIKYHPVIQKKKAESYSSESDKIFYCYYILAICFLFTDEIDDGQHLEFHYGENFSRNMDEEIAIAVALFLLYIKYDYNYRVSKYPFLNAGSMELPSVHPCFTNPYTHKYIRTRLMGNEDLATFYYKQSIIENVNVFIGHLCDNLSSLTLNSMLRNVEILETMFSEEYKELSKMNAPIEEYIKYKYIDYSTFGDMRKIDF